MDAGLAAVLGATVGAVGTGGAGVIAALLARSQARSQIQAEHLRLLREPRKQAYVAYVEACRQHFDQLSEARSKLHTLRSEGDEERRQELRQQALSSYDESSSQRAALAHLQAQVYIEGPRRMITAAVDLGGKLTHFRHAVLDVINPDIAEVGDPYATMDEASDAAYNAYLKFLYAASNAVGIDSLRAVPD